MQPNFDGYSSLSEISSIQIEFRDLARQTNNLTYEVK